LGPEYLNLSVDIPEVLEDNLGTRISRMVEAVVECVATWSSC
jgi:hypothetical protein